MYRLHRCDAGHHLLCAGKSGNAFVAEGGTSFVNMGLSHGTLTYVSLAAGTVGANTKASGLGEASIQKGC